MQTNLLEYLEAAVKRLPDKIAFSTGDDSMTFRQVYDQARAIGCALAAAGFYREPVVVIMERHPRAITAFLGTLYAGCFYVPIDEEMPRHRVRLIFDSLKPRAAIGDGMVLESPREFGWDGQVLQYDRLAAGPVDEEALAAIRRRHLDVDPAYIVFTSGSTGVPKGVAACHRSVIDYIEQLSAVLKVNESTTFGNQSPLYFDLAILDRQNISFAG